MLALVEMLGAAEGKSVVDLSAPVFIGAPAELLLVVGQAANATFATVTASGRFPGRPVALAPGKGEARLQAASKTTVRC